MNVGVYVHIPFCQVRCSYCDFNTYAGLNHLIAGYVGALCQEIREHARFHPLPDSLPEQDRITASTIYLGGGTPSLLKPALVQSILGACRDTFTVAPGAEITLEANPGTATPASLSSLQQMGVNRLSLGVQSLDDAMLRLLDRLHTAGQAREAYQAARQAGFDNISLDFMYGLPGQTLDHWQNTLAQAVALHPNHLSLYALTLEEHVPMAARVRAGGLSLPDDDAAADMYTLAEDVLDTTGFVHYEISNWAASPETRSRHNTIYWQRQPYFGFGAGAHSLVANRRYANVLHPRDYIARLQSGASPEAESEAISTRLAMAETMFLGLRLLQEGVSAQQFMAQTGQPLSAFSRQIGELTAQRLLEATGDGVILTRRGRLLSNQVFVRFLG